MNAIGSVRRHSVQVETLGLPSVWAAGYTGKGIGIAIIDSGVQSHPDLEGRLAGFGDFVDKRTEPYDDNGHGTACATQAAGNGRASAGLNMGAAPEATVVGLKAIQRNGYAWSSKVVGAIQWAVENRERYNIRVLNLSFYLDDPLVADHMPVVQALKKASDVGIIPVAAACNDGPAPRSLHTMASYPFVVTVAACDTNGTVDPSDDQIADFSSRGPGDDGQPKPDVAAPGVDVIVGTRDGSYRSGRGTSFAAPIAAGVIATWLQANPSLNVADVQRIIRDTSQPIPGYKHEDQGAGEIRAMAGLKMALEMKQSA